MRTAGDEAHGRRMRGLIVVLWRAGLRIHEGLALSEADLVLIGSVNNGFMTRRFRDRAHRATVGASARFGDSFTISQGL
jgi:hypothetical protein